GGRPETCKLSRQFGQGRQTTLSGGTSSATVEPAWKDGRRLRRDVLHCSGVFQYGWRAVSFRVPSSSHVRYDRRRPAGFRADPSGTPRGAFERDRTPGNQLRSRLRRLLPALPVHGAAQGRRSRLLVSRSMSSERVSPGLSALEPSYEIIREIGR